MHQYKMNGYNIVVDTNSSSIHAVDEVAYDIISEYATDDNVDRIVEVIHNKYPEIDKEEILECCGDVQYLIDNGQLYSEDKFKDLKLDRLHEKQEVKALCLHVAHTCNLTCDYCFAGQGKFDGEDAIMSLEVGKRAIDFLIENSGDRRNLEVDFFGGEPLINWEVCKDIVRYARSIEKEHNKNFRFTLTTNGMLINDDVIEFCNNEMYNVVLSLDGRKEVHDKYRTTRDGRGSYDIIVPKFQKLVKERNNKGYYIRGTYTKENLDFTEDIFQMVDLGFDELSLEPVVTSKDDPVAIKEEDLPIVFEQYEKLANFMIKKEEEGRPITFYHYMISLDNGPCIYKRVQGCGVGSEYMAVTPQGDLYPCHQFVGNEQFKLGDIYKGITNKELREDFIDTNLYKHEECKDCWARLFCSGGCKANAYHSSGSIDGIYKEGCEIFKKRMECAIMLKVYEAEKSEDA